MTTEWILTAILVALVLAAVAIVRASELEPGPRRVRLFVLVVSAALGTLAMIPIVELLDAADWSWLALGPALGCAAVTVGPPVVRVVVAALRRKGERL